jgi:hypothetical protein
VFVVFSIKYLQFSACLWGQTQDKDCQFQKYELKVWPEHIYSQFTMEVLSLLNSLLFPKKRNEKFFKGIELFFEDKNPNLDKNVLQSLLSKFYKKAFGSEHSKEIQQISENAFLSEDQSFKFVIQKEEIANFEEECFDFILDLDDFYARQRKEFSSKSFHRNNFYDYYLRYFVSKNGMAMLVNFAKGLSPFSSQLGKYSSPNKKIISAHFLMPVLKLLFRIINYLPKFSKYSKVISFDGNFVNSCNLEEDENILKKETKTSSSETRTLNIISRPIADVRKEALMMTAALGLEFISQFKLNETYLNDLEDVVKITFFVEEIINSIRALSNQKSLLESLSVKANGNKIDKKYFLKCLIDILKLYLENLNYAQKMTACDFLNNLSSYVSASIMIVLIITEFEQIKRKKIFRNFSFWKFYSKFV